MKRYDLACTITGVSGFVGSHLARALLHHPELDVRVFGVDLAPSHRIADLVDREEFTFLDYDVQRPIHSDALAVDTFYHFAGIANPQTYLDDPITVMKLNLGGLENVLERTVLWGKHRPRIVYSSTSEVYGKNADVPFDEEETDLVFGPTQARRWCYAMSKAVGEHYLQAYGKQHGFDYTIFRFFNLVGPDIDSPGAGRVITRMVGDAYHGGKIRVTLPGTQTRCFTYVDDFVVPLVRAATFKRLPEHPYNSWSGVINLGSDEEVSMRDLAGRVRRLLWDGHGINCSVVNVDGEKLYGAGYEDAPRRVPKLERAKRILGWEPELTLDEYLPTIVGETVARLRTAT